METSNQATRSRDRGLLLAFLVLLTVATAAGFGRVLEGGGPALRLAVAGVVAVLVGVALERRHLVLSMVASAAGLVTALGILVFPSTTFFGVPTARTLGALADAIGVLGTEAAEEVAPAPALPSLMTACVIAVWTAGAAAHALAARTGSAVLSILPPAALMAFAGVVSDGRPAPGSTVIFLIAALGILFSVGVGRLRRWGAAAPASASGRRVFGGTAAPWAIRLGIAAVAAALVLPGLLPGYQDGAVLSFEPGEGDRVSINPIVDIRPSLLDNPSADVFYVRSRRPAYWRMLSLERFDGNTWTSLDLHGRDGHLVQGTGPLFGFPGRGKPLEQEFIIASLSVPWLPAAFEPGAVSLDPADAAISVRHDPESSMLVRAEAPDRGYRYRVTSRLVAPTAKQLDRAYRTFELPLDLDRGYTVLPPDLPPAVSRIARELTAGEPTPFRQLLALQEHLKTFEYDVEAPAGHGSNHIVNFLTETRRGFCVQFAGTFAVLARTLGLPARVAVGFLPGVRDEFGRFRVTTGDAHAWPEVFFPGHGWVAFEPTPSRGPNPVAERYLSPPVVGGGPTLTQTREGSGEPATTTPGERQRADFDRIRAIRGPGGGASAAPGGDAGARRDRPWGAALVALLSLAAAALIVVAVGKAVVRRMAVRRSASARETVVAAYRVFLATAADVGSARSPGETPVEYGHRLRANVALSDGHLDRLTALADRAMYSTTTVTPREAREAVAAERASIRDLRRNAGAVRSLAAVLRPSWPLD